MVKRRLIYADELQQKFEGLKEKDAHATGRNAYDLCAMLVEDAPTVDAVPVVRGRWLGESMTCSVCGRSISEIYDADSYRSSDIDEYLIGCPFCLARMDGGNENG